MIYCVGTKMFDVSRWSIDPRHVYRVKGEYVGVYADKIVNFEGDTDLGVPIVSSFTTAPSDLGTNALKRIRSVWTKAKGDIEVEAFIDNVSAGLGTTTSKNGRIKLGRGVRGKLVQLKCTSAGPSMEVFALEYNFDELQRRYS